MRANLVAALLLPPAMAVAQPAPTSDAPTPTTETPTTTDTHCAVTIAHAPDDVREVVESWLRGESRCHGELEVRIVPTEGGLYLFARDASGRVRERVVPDAQAAGVLVASWAADDEVLKPIVQAPPSSVSATMVPAPPMALEAQAPMHEHVMLGLGAMIGSVYGMRADLDTTRYGRFVFGLSIGASTAQLDSGDGPLTLRDLNAVVYAGVIVQHDRIWLRTQAGAGAITSEFNTFIGGQAMESTGGDSAPLIEGSVRAGFDMGSWTVSAGPVARYYREKWTLDQFGMVLKRDGDLALYLGVGRRL